MHSGGGSRSIQVDIQGKVNKPHLQGLIYPGKSSIYIDMGGMGRKPRLQGLTYLRPMELYMLLC